MHFSFATQLHAPAGFDGFRARVRYYYAGDTGRGEVHLVYFNREKSGRRVRLITISRETFESHLLSDPVRLKPFEVQLELPEGLEKDEGINFEAAEISIGKNEKSTVKQRCEERLMWIAAALEVKESILTSDDPIVELNKIGRRVAPKIHPHRFQLWFFYFVLHHENIWALKKSRARTGGWDRRGEKWGSKKFGPPSSDKDNCFNSPGWRAHEEMRKYYLMKCDLGVSMRSIWIDFLLEKCRCKEVEDESGNLTFIRSDGGPIYSYIQFRNCIVQTFGLDAVQTRKYGETRIRHTKPTNDGDYSSQYSRILEGFEVDAYYCAERPKLMLGDGPAEPLVVAVGIDLKTSHTTGVGFSFGSETSEAYRAMLFSSVVPREYMERMYGIPAGHLEDWLVLGYPASFRSDRGPGGVQCLVKKLEGLFPVKTIVPSSEPLAKATVESSHPRQTNLEGTPSYVLSDLNTVQMMKREVYNARLSSFKKNISPKLSEKEISDLNRGGRSATPHDYADYLLARLATAATSMSIPMAVRILWTPFKLKVGADGARYRHRMFSSADYLKSDFRRRLGSREVEVAGYYLTAVFRIVWLELDGRLVEVEATRKSRQDAEDSIVPKTEVEAVAKQLKELNSRTRRAGAAAEGQTRDRFQASEKVGWTDGKRMPGTPGRGKGTAAAENSALKGMPAKEKRA